MRFIEVLLTPTDLAIVMEYASGGELFDRVLTNGRMQEDEARYFLSTVNIRRGLLSQQRRGAQRFEIGKRVDR